MSDHIKLRVNGVEHSVESGSDAMLLYVLRDELGLTGSKYGCGEGECGACTVLVDGKPFRSCRTALSVVGAKSVVTIEGLERSGELHPLQQAFLDEGAYQCAYCTSGMIMSGVAFLKQNPNPSDDDIARGMQGNVCRCGTYPRITAAIRRAARNMKESHG